MRELPCFADPANLVEPGKAQEAEPELAPGATSLDFLQKIYRSSTQPIARRMRAAIAALPFESPKLTAVAIFNGEGFAARLEQARLRSAPFLIEHRTDERQSDGR